jgi:hypothetical protein
MRHAVDLLRDAAAQLRPGLHIGERGWWTMHQALHEAAYEAFKEQMTVGKKPESFLEPQQHEANRAMYAWMSCNGKKVDTQLSEDFPVDAPFSAEAQPNSFARQCLRFMYLNLIADVMMSAELHQLGADYAVHFGNVGLIEA